METHVLPTLTVTLHEDGYVLGEAKEGVEISAETAQKVISLAHEFFDRPYGVLINRKNDYSVDFGTYQAMTSDVMIRAVAIVVRRERSRTISSAEKTFFKSKDYAVFDDMDTAKKWLLERVNTPA